MDDWIEQYMKMFMISPTTATTPKYESLTLDIHSHSNSYNSPHPPDSSHYTTPDTPPQPPTSLSSGQVSSNFDVDFRKDLMMGIMRKQQQLNTEDRAISGLGVEQALKNSKPSQHDTPTRKSLSSIANLARTDSTSLSNTSFTSQTSEEAYVTGMLKGYERGMKISKSLEKSSSNFNNLSKRDSFSQVPDVEIKFVESVSTSTGTEGAELQTSSKGPALLFPGIVKRKSHRDRLDKMLERNNSKLRGKEKVGCARSAKMHGLLSMNPAFKDNLSEIMNRKHRESINMGIKSYTALDPTKRADLYQEKVDYFKEKIESVVKDIMQDKSFYEHIPTMHLPPISVFSPVQSEKQSIDLGKILALSDDIKDMVDYWRTHSLISLNSDVSKKVSEGTSTLQSEEKPTDVKKADTKQVKSDVNTQNANPVFPQETKVLDKFDTAESEDTLSNANSSLPSTECMTSEGSIISTSSSDRTENSTNENECNDLRSYRSDILKQLDVGLVTKLATSSGDLVTYSILCLTHPGIIVEKCWLYWKVLAIVPLSSVERDGRVQVGDILFEIDGRSLRGLEKSVVTEMLLGYQDGRLLHLTLLKRSHKPDNTGKRLLVTRSIAKFPSICQFLVDDEIRYSTKFKSALEAGGFP